MASHGREDLLFDIGKKFEGGVEANMEKYGNSK
jgi:hypothetical protein